VTLVSRSQAKLDVVAEEIHQASPNVTVKVVPLDLATASGEDIEKLFSSEQNSIVVSNAGVANTAKVFEADPQ